MSRGVHLEGESSRGVVAFVRRASRVVADDCEVFLSRRRGFANRLGHDADVATRQLVTRVHRAETILRADRSVRVHVAFASYSSSFLRARRIFIVIEDEAQVFSEELLRVRLVLPPSHPVLAPVPRVLARYLRGRAHARVVRSHRVPRHPRAAFGTLDGSLLAPRLVLSQPPQRDSLPAVSARLPLEPTHVPVRPHLSSRQSHAARVPLVPRIRPRVHQAARHRLPLALLEMRIRVDSRPRPPAPRPVGTREGSPLAQQTVRLGVPALDQSRAPRMRARHQSVFAVRSVF